MGRGITPPSSTCSDRQVPSSPCLHSPFWKQGQEQQLTHTDCRLLRGENVLSSAAKQARLQTVAALPCLSPTLCFPKHTVPPVCTTTPSTNSSVKSKAGLVPQLLMLPIASPEHTLLTPRENPDKKPKQNPQESKCSKLYFTWCKLKTTAPTYFSSSSSLSIYF